MYNTSSVVAYKSVLKPISINVVTMLKYLWNMQNRLQSPQHNFQALCIYIFFYDEGRSVLGHVNFVTNVNVLTLVI
jgi:hypothetical protein